MPTISLISIPKRKMQKTGFRLKREEIKGELKEGL